MKKKIEKILGKSLLRIARLFYHGSKSYLASLYFRRPSDNLFLIGVTGTKGKTSTTILVGRVLNLLGIRTGYISTAILNLEGKQENEFINTYKNTTLDGFLMHKFLAKIKANNCQVAVLEMSSIGLEQGRHKGLKKFDIATILNMYPEHIDYHGDWEKYKIAKGVLFRNLRSGGYFVCNDDKDQQEIKNYLWSLVSDKINTHKIPLKNNLDYEIIEEPGTLEKSISWSGTIAKTHFTTDFEIKNLAFALEIGRILEPSIEKKVTQIIDKVGNLPGRMEFVVKHNQVIWPIKETKIYSTNPDISIMVDYAHEPKSMEKLLTNLANWRDQKYYTQVIHILSCDGAGRDNWKKPIMGEISYKYADHTVITTDNYDENDNPKEIINLLSQKIKKQALKNKKITSIIDRRKSFQKALEIAKTNKKETDKILIVSTGVGTEQSLTQPGGRMAWDERQVWKEVFKQNKSI